MNVGMMWFNDNPKVPLAEKVLEAVHYYRQKYGQNPDLCLVNPAAFIGASDDESLTVGSVAVRALRSILPGHLWIGVKENGDAK